MELHVLRHHVAPTRLEFLPYHFLLVSVGATGHLKYQDTSTGQIVADHRTRLGPCDCMRQNPANAIICLGHHNGTVTMWNPNMSTPLVKMLCHRGGVTGIAVDQRGLYVALHVPRPSRLLTHARVLVSPATSPPAAWTRS